MAANERRIIFNSRYAPLFDASVPCRYFIVTGGRGSGKSYAVSAAAMVAHCAADYNILYLRQTLVSAHVSVIPEFHEKLCMMGMDGLVARSNTSMRNLRSGWSVFFKGLQTNAGSNIAQLKSIKRVGLALVDEAQELVDEEAFDRVDLSLRDKGVANRVWLSLNPTDKDHWIYRRFFESRGVPEDFNGVAGDACYIHTTYLDNLRNLDADFIRLARECERDDPPRYRNIFLGFWKGDAEGALWSAGMIDAHRVASAPDGMERIVVGVDPAVTSDERSDETGVVVAGRARLRGETHYFVLADRSLRGTPNTWASAAVNACREFGADRVVAEVNNGGDLVETLMRQSSEHVPYKAVRASRGKITRAEPVAALYERGLVHHVGRFGELEGQMRCFAGTRGEKSPDRMDALVWALTELADGFGSVALTGLGGGTPDRDADDDW